MAFTSSAAETAELIRKNYSPMWTNGLFENNDYLPHLPEAEDSGGDTALRFFIRSSSNDAIEIFTEGQVQPDPGSQGWVPAAVAWQYVRGMIEITGHARDALRSRYFNVIDQEAILTQTQMRDLVTTTWLNSTVGLEAAVDSTTAYAGITRGSASYFESLETAVGAPVSYTDLSDMEEDLQNAERGANWRQNGVIFCAPTQRKRIYNVTGGPSVRMVGDGDAAPQLTDVRFAGRPVVEIRDLTSTVIIFADMTPGKWEHKLQRPFSVKPMGAVTDADVYQLSEARGIACTHTKHQGKLTGCTA